MQGVQGSCESPVSCVPGPRLFCLLSSVSEWKSLPQQAGSFPSGPLVAFSYFTPCLFLSHVSVPTQSSLALPSCFSDG